MFFKDALQQIATYQHKPISPEFIIVGGRTLYDYGHIVTENENQQYVFNDTFITLGNIYTKNISGSLVTFKKGILMPKALERVYLKIEYSMYAELSSTSGNRFIRPYITDESGQNIIYQDIPFQSLNTPNSRANFSGQTVIPIIDRMFDSNEDTLTIALKRYMLTNDVIDNWSWIFTLFIMS